MANQTIYYDNRFGDGAPVASSTASGFDVANLFDFQGFTWWKPSAMPATITVDCGGARAADYGLLWGHDLFSQGCSITIRGSTDNFVSSDVNVTPVTPAASNKPMLLSFASASYRYWRIEITSGGGVPTIANALVGDALLIPAAGMPQGFDPLGREVVSQYNVTQEGHPLSQIVEYERFDGDLLFEFITWAWLRATWLPAWAAHLGARPWFYGWDPVAYPEEIHMLSARQRFSSPHLASGYTNLSLPVEGLALKA